MANVSQTWKAYGNNRDENGAMGNGGEPVRTPEEWENIGGSKLGTDSDGYEKEKAGMVRARQKKRWYWKHPSSCGIEDGGEVPYKTYVAWKDTARRDLKAWNIREEWATDRERWKGLCKTRHPTRETAAKGEKERIWINRLTSPFVIILQLDQNALFSIEFLRTFSHK